MLYTGIDLHRRSIVVCTLDENSTSRSYLWLTLKLNTLGRGCIIYFFGFVWALLSHSENTPMLVDEREHT